MASNAQPEWRFGLFAVGLQMATQVKTVEQATREIACTAWAMAVGGMAMAWHGHGMAMGEVYSRV